MPVMSVRLSRLISGSPEFASKVKNYGKLSQFFEPIVDPNKKCFVNIKHLFLVLFNRFFFINFLYINIIYN